MPDLDGTNVTCLFYMLLRGHSNHIVQKTNIDVCMSGNMCDWVNTYHWKAHWVGKDEKKQVCSLQRKQIKFTWRLQELSASITIHSTGCVFVLFGFITCYLLFVAAEAIVSTMLHRSPSCWWSNKSKAECFSLLGLLSSSWIDVVVWGCRTL